jgi:protein-disulfide isomerase
VSELPTVEQTFILSGQAKLEVKPIAILGEGSVLAAQGAGCANEQGRFWEYHNILYANQKSERRQQTAGDLKSYAAAIGLDTGKFGSCLDSGKYAATVSNDTDAAKQVGVTSTPTIFVNGREVESTADAVGKAIQRELAAGS